MTRLTHRAAPGLPNGRYADGEAPDGVAIADVGRVRALLIEAARAGEPLSYAGLLHRLGVRFTRPRMRALCRTLDRIDADGAATGEPALAVLVVRESDRMPGQGWWVARAATGYAGPWSGPTATAAVAALQEAAFTWWQRRPAGSTPVAIRTGAGAANPAWLPHNERETSA